MFGDAALGSTNLRMIEVCRSVGAAAKFTGSGGAAVVLCSTGEQKANLKSACDNEQFTVLDVKVATPASVSVV